MGRIGLSHRNSLCTLLACLAAWAPSCLTAAEETQNWLQLQRLNQHSRMQLKQLQQQAQERTQPIPAPADRSRQQRETQQWSELLRLQERQRRRQLIDGHRQRVLPATPGFLPRQQEQIRRMQNRQEQRQLLQRYRFQAP